MTLEELAEELGVTLNDDHRQVIESYLESETAGLKRTNRELKEEKRRLQAKVDNGPSLDLEALAGALGRDADDLDIDDLPALIEAVKGTGEGRKDDARVQELERKLDRMKKAHQTELGDREDRLATMRNRMLASEMRSKAAEAIEGAKGSVKGLMPHVMARLKAEMDDEGRIDIVPLGANGEPMEDARGNPASIKDVVADLKRDEDFGGLFLAEPGGSGARPSRGGRQPNKKWSEMNLDERSALKRDNPALANQLANAG